MTAVAASLSGQGAGRRPEQWEQRWRLLGEHLIPLLLDGSITRAEITLLDLRESDGAA